MDWTLIFAFIMLFAMIATLVLGVILWLVTGRYFDRLLKERNIPYPQTISMIPSGIRRGMRYVGYIVYRKPRKRDIYRNMTGEFDFRTHARKIDIVLTIIYMSLLVVYAVCFAVLGAVSIFT